MKGVCNRSQLSLQRVFGPMSGFEELVYPLVISKHKCWLMWKDCCSLLNCCIFLCVHSRGEAKKQAWQVGLGSCCVLVLHLFNFLSNFKDFLSFLKHCCTLICNQCLMFIFLSFRSTTKLLYKQISTGCSDIDDVSLSVVRYVHLSYNKWHRRDFAKQSAKKWWGF